MAIQKNNKQLPVLYSFRRCPYAIRTRMALYYSGVEYELREIVLKDKPKQLAVISEKGTIPVLQLSDGRVLDESLEIMQWALRSFDPDQWGCELNHALIKHNDAEFKYYLDRYKYFDRFPEYSQNHYFQKALGFIEKLELNLLKSNAGFLMGEHITSVDVAIFPFIRQFAFVDKAAFDVLPYSKVKKWLDYFLGSTLFETIMQKHQQWKVGDLPVIINLNH